MNKEIAKIILKSPGVLRTDAVWRYQKVSTILDFSEYSFEMGVSKSLKAMLGKGVTWTFLPEKKANIGHTLKVKHREKIYYLRVNNEINHLSRLIAKSAIDECEIPDLKTPKLLAHGTLLCEDEPKRFFTLSEKASGSPITKLFFTKDYENMSKFYAHLGKTLAKIHSQNITRATKLEKFKFSDYFMRKVADQLLKGEQSNTSLVQEESRDRYINTIVPQLLESQKKYLESPQYKTLELPIQDVSSLCYDADKNSITSLGGDDLIHHSSPTEAPSGPPEKSLTKILSDVDQATVDYGLDVKKMANCKASFINNYTQNIKHKSLSDSGLIFFRKFEYAETYLNSLNSDDNIPESKQRMVKILQQFTKFHSEKSKDINLEDKID